MQFPGGPATVSGERPSSMPLSEYARCVSHTSDTGGSGREGGGERRSASQETCPCDVLLKPSEERRQNCNGGTARPAWNNTAATVLPSDKKPGFLRKTGSFAVRREGRVVSAWERKGHSGKVTDKRTN